MRKHVLAAALIAASSPALASSSTDLICTVKDTANNSLIYTFDGNSRNDDGSFGGTMVETGFDKNGTSVMSAVGKRPVWIYSGNTVGGMTLYSRAAPGWLLVIGDMTHRSDGLHAKVMLAHNDKAIGVGECYRASVPTADSVGDLG